MMMMVTMQGGDSNHFTSYIQFILLSMVMMMIKMKMLTMMMMMRMTMMR